jgi:hypothetical protein
MEPIGRAVPCLVKRGKGFVYPEGFKKNTEYILFLRSICFGVEGCGQRMVAGSVYSLGRPKKGS